MLSPQLLLFSQSLDRLERIYLRDFHFYNGKFEEKHGKGEGEEKFD